MNLQTFYIAKSGWMGAFVLSCLFLISLFCDFSFLSFFFLCLLLCWLIMFRNPERLATHLSPNAFLAPIDGKITQIQSTGDKTSITIEVGLFDVGVLRAPINLEDFRHSFIFGTPLIFSSKKDFFSPQESLNFSNHSMSLQRYFLHQPSIGDASFYERGERMGFLKVGKLRLELEKIELKVNVGDKIKGGESILGYLQ